MPVATFSVYSSTRGYNLLPFSQGGAVLGCVHIVYSFLLSNYYTFRLSINDNIQYKSQKNHFKWGKPTSIQKSALKKYIDKDGDMSIYGDTGIYERLESWLADYYKQKYVILTSTGTSSLNSGYVGLGIARGDEVIVPTYTFLATVTPLLRLGAIPVFADADPVTGGISPKDIEEKITPKTKAIAVTHMWGVACDMESIMYIAQKNNLRVLEDCSHAHFTKYNQKLLGTFGDVACFSIGAKKLSHLERVAS